jgi:hypothetical protein
LGNFATHIGNSNELMLIDFGRAKYVSEKDIKAATKDGNFCTYEEHFHPFLGKWEMISCKPAFRDDVYRAIAMTAVIMHGSAHLKYLKILPEFSKDLFREIKRTGNFFNLPQFRYLNPDGKAYVLGELSVKQVSDIPDGDTLKSIQSHLDKISAFAVHEDKKNPYLEPQYDLIIAEFEEILKLLN